MCMITADGRYICCRVKKKDYRFRFQAVLVGMVLRISPAFLPRDRGGEKINLIMFWMTVAFDRQRPSSLFFAPPLRS